MPRFFNTTLENGLQVIAEQSESAYSLSAGFFVKTGSRDESPELAGVSHFLEHMAFKGNEKRNAIQVNQDFDRVGAKHNAQTSEEDTVYHVTALPEYFPQAFEVLSGLMQPSLREDDFETEKQVIIEEIKMYQDNPMSVAYEAAKALHYGAHPLAGSVLGTVDSINALPVKAMRDYYQARYGPSNLVLALAGKVDWDQALDLVASIAAAGRVQALAEPRSLPKAAASSKRC